MGDKPKVLIDVNIILDVLQHREPFYATSAQILSSAEIGSIQAHIAAHTLTTLFYLVAKDRSPETARIVLTELLNFLEVSPVNQVIIEGALNLPYRDLEDAVQMMCAVNMRADYLVTRYIKDYSVGPVKALKPDELLALL